MVPVTQRIYWNVVRGYRGGFPSRSNAHPNSIPRGSDPRVGTQLVALKWEWYYLALVNNPYHSRPKDSFSFSLIWFSSFGGKGEAGKSKRTGPGMGSPVTSWVLPTIHSTRYSGSDGKTRDYNTCISPSSVIGGKPWQTKWSSLQRPQETEQKRVRFYGHD